MSLMRPIWSSWMLELVEDESAEFSRFCVNMGSSESSRRPKLRASEALVFSRILFMILVYIEVELALAFCKLEFECWMSASIYWYKSVGGH